MTENTKLTKIKIFRRENVQEFLVSLSVCVCACPQDGGSTVIPSMSSSTVWTLKSPRP